MAKLFDKFPRTIMEELNFQIMYRIDIDKNDTNIKADKILNDADLSNKMIKTKIDIFNLKRKDYDEYSTRAGTISELKNIVINEKAPKYLDLFCTFKALNIIRENYNIIQLLNYYRIEIKKKIDKTRMEELKSKNDQICVSMCCRCKTIEQKRCDNYDECPFRKIKNRLNEILDIDEKIKLLYRLGVPSNWFDILTVFNCNSYNISVQTLKNILEYLEMFDKIEILNYLEKNYQEIFIKMVKESRDDWKNDIEEIKTRIKEINKTKNLEELQELFKLEKQYKEIEGYLKQSKDENLNKIKPYYLSRIEEECCMKENIPKKTIH